MLSSEMMKKAWNTNLARGFADLSMFFMFFFFLIIHAFCFFQPKILFQSAY